MKIKDEIIKSRNNSLIKWAASLQDKKYRQKEKRFLIEGEKLCFDALEKQLEITHIFVCENIFSDILPQIKSRIDGKINREFEVISVSEEAISKISSEKAPQGVITIIKYLDNFNILDIIYKEEFFLKNDERALILCSIRDPGNLGSVIRSAVAFGITHIILSDDCADIYNTKTIRGAMGSLFKIKVTKVKNIISLIMSAQHNGRRVFAAELTERAKSLDELKIFNNDIFIIGNEGHGIPDEISQVCDSSVYIPISANTESLNASVAAAIFMWEQSKAD